MKLDESPLRWERERIFDKIFFQSSDREERFERKDIVTGTRYFKMHENFASSTIQERCQIIRHQW